MNTTAVSPAQPGPPTVTVEADRVLVSHLELADAALARYVEAAPEPDRVGMASNALRIGLQAMANAGTNANVDLVRAEFGRMVEQMVAVHPRGRGAGRQPARHVRR
jgi:hypothetical protein